MTVLLWQITDYWLYLVVVLVFILVFKSHRHSLCLGFSAVKATCRQRMSNSRREFSVLISFIRLGLSLSSLSPSDHPVRPHSPLWRKIVKGPHSVQFYSLSLRFTLQWMFSSGSPGNTNFSCLQGETFTQQRTGVFWIFPPPRHCRWRWSIYYTYTKTAQQISQYTRTSILTGPVLTPLTPDKLPSVNSFLARK